MSERASVQVGSVTIALWEHAKGWRFGYQISDGTWKYITRTEKKEAMELARDKAREINNGTVDLANMSPAQASVVRRVLEMGITHGDLDEWEINLGRKKILVSTAIQEFLAAKESAQGASGQNVKTLKTNLGSLSRFKGDLNIHTLSANDIDSWLVTYKDRSARTRRNLRASAVTFFRWCRDRGYLPDTKRTEAEKANKPIVRRKIPSTWTPAEIKTLLAHCPPDYIPWLISAGFAGVRHEEMILPDRSKKAPLSWEDFQWDRDIIIVRPETSKTGDRRIVPILPVVRAWLYPLRQESGPICPQKALHRSDDRKSPTLTKILGATVGGWKINALRHSFISYRAAKVGLAQAAREAGNSEAEARKSYNDAKSEAEADQWFALLPSEIIGSKS